MGILFLNKEDYHSHLIYNCTWSPYPHPDKKEECLMCTNLWGTLIVLSYDTLVKLEEKYNREARVVLGG